VTRRSPASRCSVDTSPTPEDCTHACLSTTSTSHTQYRHPLHRTLTNMTLRACIPKRRRSLDSSAKWRSKVGAGPYARIPKGPPLPNKGFVWAPKAVGTPFTHTHTHTPLFRSSSVTPAKAARPRTRSQCVANNNVKSFSDCYIILHL